MVFSSPIFLFLFLPVVLAVYLLIPGVRPRNLWLLISSLIFYAWGELAFIALMLSSTLMNYLLGLWVDKTNEPHQRKIAVGIAVALNIGTLAFFKYSNFVLANVNMALDSFGIAPIKMDPVRLPIGISFFTFHALSYVIDIYRRKWPAARNPGDTALYIFLFPQLIAGPILRWSAMAPQFIKRKVTSADFAEGIRRFVGGLAKKMIIANVVALPADQIFSLPPEQVSTSVAWFGALCYTLQIYFDFSGYSDMAVGLGKMFGFDFLENFNFPYIARSIQDFWRRWHISLSSWFRDYLYIPLGGNRCSTLRNYSNLIIVFFLCGLWHGASWTFVIWGLFHGVFLVLERTKFGTAIEKLPVPLRHVYTIVVVMVGWVLFRADTFAQAVAVLKAMAGFAPAGNTTQPLGRYVGNQVIVCVLLGIIFATPFWSWLKRKAANIPEATPHAVRPYLHGIGLAIETTVVIAVLLVSAAWLAGGTYNPFIYFRF